MGILEKINSFHDSHDTSEPPPPTYNEATHYQQPQSTSHSPHQPPFPSSHSSHPDLFPPQFNVYLHTSTWTLGPHASSPNHTIFTPDLRRSITLVPGPNQHAPPLASVKPSDRGSVYELTIFPHPGSTIAEPLLVTVEDHANKHSFCITLSNGQHPQFFEWRSSKGDAVQSLGVIPRGWKLVRLRSPANNGEEEVVAAVASHDRMSRNKKFRFGFWGSGLEGGLGSEAQVAAVATAMYDMKVWMARMTRIATMGA